MIGQCKEKKFFPSTLRISIFKDETIIISEESLYLIFFSSNLLRRRFVILGFHYLNILTFFSYQYIANKMYNRYFIFQIYRIKSLINIYIHDNIFLLLEKTSGCNNILLEFYSLVKYKGNVLSLENTME